MKGIKIRDMHPRGFLAVDLRDLLALLGSKANALTWSAEGVWATGAQAQELEAIPAGAPSCSGEELLEAAKAVTQVIDGEFTGYLPGSDQPEVIIKAVDSSWYELYSNDPEVLSQAQLRFTETSVIPEGNE